MSEGEIKISDQTKKTSFRFSLKLFKDFKKACTDRDLQQSDAIEQAVRLWLRVPLPEPARMPTTDANIAAWKNEWIRSVMDFLASTLADAEVLLERGRKAISTEAGNEKGTGDLVEKAAQIIRTAKDQIQSSEDDEGDRDGDQPAKQPRKRRS